MRLTDLPSPTLYDRDRDVLLETPTNPGFHFLDSGAFTMRILSKRWAKKEKRPVLEFYDSDVFLQYRDHYIEFVKEFGAVIDRYSNIDVIGSPELTWRNQQYLESKGLKPVPVIHNRTPHKWIKTYLDYDYIAFGGLAGRKRGDGSKEWLDEAFDIVCSTPNRHPSTKVHGFGIGEHSWLFRYPWFSVDYAGWTSAAAYGSIYMPPYRQGKFRFDLKPYSVTISDESPEIQSSHSRHFLAMSKGEKNVVLKWLDFVNVPLGRRDEKGEIVEKGVTTFHTFRRYVNMVYYHELEKILPSHERPFTYTKKKGFF